MFDLVAKCIHLQTFVARTLNLVVIFCLQLEFVPLHGTLRQIIPRTAAPAGVRPRILAHRSHCIICNDITIYSCALIAMVATKTALVCTISCLWTSGAAHTQARWHVRTRW